MDKNTHAQIIKILDQTMDMTLATVRPDGFPQATVVAFVHDDLMIYFSTAPNAQKALNIAACDKVSLTVTPPYTKWEEIEGLSMGGHARRVTDPDEVSRANLLFAERFPGLMDAVPEDPAGSTLFRFDPTVISLLDYSRGFGYAELIDVQEKLMSPA
jgi:hypothetical protein